MVAYSGKRRRSKFHWAYSLLVSEKKNVGRGMSAGSMTPWAPPAIPPALLGIYYLIRSMITNGLFSHVLRKQSDVCPKGSPELYSKTKCYFIFKKGGIKGFFQSY